MADKSISELAVAQQMTDDALAVVYQNGETKAIEGQLIKKYARESTEPYVEGAVQSAKEAAESAKQAGVSAATAKENADKTAADVVVVQAAADAERERVEAEAARKAAEDARKAEEEKRSTSEQTRTANETTRQEAETGRTAAEQTRAGNESARDAAESERAEKEGQRVRAETGRAEAEQRRETAEAGRISAETGRETAEADRVEKESARAAEEGKRSAAEGTRASNETRRVEAETERAAKEAERLLGEEARVAGEQERVTAEEAREAAERARADETAGIVVRATEQAELAAGSAETATAQAGIAATKAGEAAASAAAAKQSETNSKASETAAKASETAAAGSAGTAKTEADRAKTEADRAAEIVGGDFATKAQAQGYVNTHAADTEAHKALFAGKADLVDGKVKAEQLPPIKTDQVVEQTATPTSPDTILWVDTDEETPGVDIEGIRAEAELAHTTADSAITRLNGVDESITAIQNKNVEQDNYINNLLMTDTTFNGLIGAVESRVQTIEEGNGVAVKHVEAQITTSVTGLMFNYDYIWADGTNLYIDVDFVTPTVEGTNNIFTISFAGAYNRKFPSTVIETTIIGDRGTNGTHIIALDTISMTTLDNGTTLTLRVEGLPGGRYSLKCLVALEGPNG